MAKIWGGKFTHISPVWLQILSNYEIRGLHDVDSGWMRDVRKANVKRE